MTRCAAAVLTAAAAVSCAATRAQPLAEPPCLEAVLPLGAVALQARLVGQAQREGREADRRRDVEASVATTLRAGDARWDAALAATRPLAHRADAATAWTVRTTARLGTSGRIEARVEPRRREASSWRAEVTWGRSF